MRHGILSVAALILLMVCPFIGNAEMTAPGDSQLKNIAYETFAPEAVDNPTAAAQQKSQVENGKQVAQNQPSKDKAKKEESAPVQKSTRKAFFLSMLLPGLGEYYVGSKRSFFFLGVEAVAWYIYMSNTGKGNDLDTQFKKFADAHWHYADTKSSTGEDLVYNYFNWFKDKLRENNLSDDVLSTNFAAIDTLTDAMIKIGKSGITHSLPSSKTQQYYEMIGKYPQFVYGWEDITGYTKSTKASSDSVTYYNPTLVDPSTGKANENFDENIRNVISPMRTQYMDMRDESNKKLKLGEDGIDLMIINRVVSAIDAARLAYHHNKKVDSELSMVRMYIVQKQINDHKVPMLMFTKKF